MAAPIASLLVDLQLNSAAMRAGLDAANAKLQTFAQKVAGIGKTIAAVDKKIAAFGALKGVEIGKDVVVGLARFVKHGAEVADQMGKLAQSAGVPVEALSKLDYAAGLSGISTEELGGALARLNKNIGAAAGGSKEQVALFEALGVKVTDASGKVRGAEVILGELAGKFAGLKDGPSKATLAMELFGKTGANLIPFLNQGKEGLAQLGDEASRLGLVITAEGAAGAERFNDELEKLRRAGEGVAIRVATQLAPALSGLAEQLLNTSAKTGALDEAASVLATTLRLLVSAGTIVGSVFQILGTQIGRAASALVSAAHGDFDELLNLNDGMWQDIVDGATSAVERINTIWDNNGVRAELKKTEEQSKKSADGIVRNMAAAKRGADEALRKAAETLRRELASISAERERAVAKLQLTALSKRADLADVGPARAELGGLSESAFLRATGGQGDLDQTPLFGAREDLHGRFKDLNDALAELTERLTQHAYEVASAQSLEAKAKALRAKADDTKLPEEVRKKAAKEAEAKEKAALEARQAAEGLQILADRADQAAQAFADQARAQAAAREQFAVDTRDKLLGPDIGALVNAGTTGAAAGGPAGAAIGVGVELLTRSKQFDDVMKLVSAIIQQVADALGSIIGPLTPFLGAVFNVVGALVKGLQPAFDLLASILEPFIPIVQLFAVLLQGLAPVIGLIAKLFLLINAPLTFLATLALPPLFEVLKFVARVLLDVVLAVTKVWNELIQGVRAVLYKIGGLFKDVPVLSDAFYTLGNALGGLVVPTQDIENAQKELAKLTFEGAKAAAADTAATILHEKTVRKVNDELTNLPQGFRVQAARFAAMATEGAAPDGVFGGAAPGGVTVNNYGTIMGIEDFVSQVNATNKQRQFRKYGA